MFHLVFEDMSNKKLWHREKVFFKEGKTWKLSEYHLGLRQGDRNMDDSMGPAAVMVVLQRNLLLILPLWEEVPNRFWVIGPKIACCAPGDHVHVDSSEKWQTLSVKYRSV